MEEQLCIMYNYLLCVGRRWYASIVDENEMQREDHVKGTLKFCSIMSEMDGISDIDNYFGMEEMLNMVFLSWVSNKGEKSKSRIYLCCQGCSLHVYGMFKCFGIFTDQFTNI